MGEFSIKKSIWIRAFIVGFLIILLLIPASMVKGLIAERKSRRDEVVREVSEKWGGAQMVAGPILSVPYMEYFRDSKGVTHSSKHHAHFLPDELSIEGEITPEVRYRGIFEVMLYNANLRLSGRFLPLDFSELDIPAKDVNWQGAFLSIGISDMKGIREAIGIQWNGKDIPANPGLKIAVPVASGVSMKTALDPAARGYAFSFGLNLNGSETLMFAPFGKVTVAKISSPWETPSFAGRFLPEKRTVGENGFSAQWKVLHLNRNYPQSWTDEKQDLDLAYFGAKLLFPVDSYQKTMRTAKYALMFITLTFLTFLMIEILTRRAVHPVQYLLVGFALILFYALLLSLSEHISFALAYLISSASMVALVTAYSVSILAPRKLALVVTGVLAALYGYLYVVLQLEDYALLMGSLGLLAILAAVMFLTRKLDWFNLWKSGNDG